MDQLPPELVSLIVSHLDPDTLGPYARISRQWQLIVEKHTFGRVRVQSTELDKFQDMFALPHRREALGTLIYHVLLPEYSEDRMAKFERRRERDANNQAFSAAVVELLSVIESWESRQSGILPFACTRGRRIALHLGAYSLTDIARPRPQDDLKKHRYERSILTLLDSVELPEVERVTGFFYPGDCELATRTLRAASVARIASRFPKVARMELGLEDCAFSEDTIRHKYRKEFADALLTMQTQNLTDFYLRFRFKTLANEAFKFPSGTDPNSPSVDDLSLALHTLLSRSPILTRLIITGPIALSPSIFTGPSPSASSSQSTTVPSPLPLWPRLRTLIIELSRTTPTTAWLYTRNPNDSADDLYDSARSGSVTPPFSGSDNPIDSDDSMWHETYHPYHHGLTVGQRPRRQYRTKLDHGAWEPYVTAATESVLLGRGVRAPALEALTVVVAGRWEGELGLWWDCEEGGRSVEKRRRRRVTYGPYGGEPGEPERWWPSEGLVGLWREWLGEEGWLDEDQEVMWSGSLPETLND